MKFAKYLISACLLILLVSKSNAQGLETALIALKTRNIGKVIKSKTEYHTSKASYLGRVTDKNNKAKYYVVKEF